MRTSNIWHKPGLLLLTLAIAFAAAEGGVRVLGLVDYPLYEVNAQIGYIPAANQQGSFLNKNDWQFNAHHMGAPAFRPDRENDVLLVGDSLVLGGNQYRAPERLGPSLQVLMDQVATNEGNVWPIAAGSWAMQNELAYLRLNPEVPASSLSGLSRKAHQV